MSKIDEAISIIAALGAPNTQLNERSALSLLALIQLRENGSWQILEEPLLSIRAILDFCRNDYRKPYAENSRESFRRETLQYFVASGLAVKNPDDPARPSDSPKSYYQISPVAKELLMTFGTKYWDSALKEYLEKTDTQSNRTEEELDDDEYIPNLVEKHTVDIMKKAEAEAHKLILLGQQRASELIEDAKSAARSEGDRILKAAKEQIDAQAIEQGIALSKENILRVIEFPPEHRQAGISILSYFSEVLKQKHPNSDAKIAIEQFGTKVRLIIHPTSGQSEIIEKTLEEYGHVISGALLPRQFLENEFHALQLSNKLELVNLELKMTKQLLTTTTTLSDSRISGLENEIVHLRSLIGQSFSQLSSTQSAINLLLRRYAGSKDLSKALSVIEMAIKNTDGSPDKAEVQKALEDIRSQKPSILSELYDILKGGATDAAGDLFPWIISFINAMPK